MKERLIIISDLWGREKSKWLTTYTYKLKTKFDVVFYDSCEIGEVDKSNYIQESLQSQFVNGGTELAIKKLIELEKEPVNILAFSVGGVIAWNYGLQTDNIKSLVCVSSTRLRKESKKPNGRIVLYFGEHDAYRPSIEWAEQMQLDVEVIPNKSHEVYREKEFAEYLSGKTLKSLS